MTSIRLHRQVCAFIDILGGADLFQGKNRERAASFFNQMAEFERRLNGWSRHFPKKRRAKALVKTFSDNIFVAFPLGSSENLTDAQIVNTFLSELNHQIVELTIFTKFPVRGAVTVGPLMFTDQFLFGPALVETVQMEKSAIFPRVLLSDKVLKYVTPELPSSALVLHDADGKRFMNYLSHLPHVLMENHMNYVVDGLQKNSHNVPIRQKYEWLVRYHNHCAEEKGYADLVISPSHIKRFSRPPELAPNNLLIERSSLLRMSGDSPPPMKPSPLSP